LENSKNEILNTTFKLQIGSITHLQPESTDGEFL